MVVVTAILNGELEEDIYVPVSEGVERVNW